MPAIFVTKSFTASHGKKSREVKIWRSRWNFKRISVSGQAILDEDKDDGLVLFDDWDDGGGGGVCDLDDTDVDRDDDVEKTLTMRKGLTMTMMLMIYGMISKAMMLRLSCWSITRTVRLRPLWMSTIWFSLVDNDKVWSTFRSSESWCDCRHL